MPFYDDDGSELNADLVSKPSLCFSCVNDDDVSREQACIHIRMKNDADDDFDCRDYRRKSL
jgi:hypothetical protein